MFNFLHTFSPNPVFLDLGFVKIYYYGLIFAIAAFIGYFLLLKLAKKRGVDLNVINDLVFYLFIFGLIGARLYHVFFYNFAYFSQNFWEIFMIWKGGIAIQGAIIGDFFFLLFYCRKRHLKFWEISDLLTIPLILGQAIGRWGNFFNQELYGQPTDSAWGIFISPDNRLPGYENFSYFQPLFFYEFILNLFLFFILLFLFKKKTWPAGFIALSYLVGYSSIKFFLEFFRIEPTVLIFNWRLPQLVSLGIITISLFFLKKMSKNAKANI